MASLSLVSQVTCYHVQTHSDNPRRDGFAIHIPELNTIGLFLRQGSCQASMLANRALREVFCVSHTQTRAHATSLRALAASLMRGRFLRVNVRFVQYVITVSYAVTFS